MASSTPGQKKSPQSPTHKLPVMIASRPRLAAGRPCSRRSLVVPSVRRITFAPLSPPSILPRRRVESRAQQQPKSSSTEGSESASSSVESTDSATGTQQSMDEETSKKLADIRKEQQLSASTGGGSANPFQGAVEQAQLITWPKPQKALLDTVLVLAIVIGTGTLLLGVNVVLANASELWYHRS